MQEVLMAVSAVPRRSSQLPLFARPQRNPHWTDLSSDVQQTIVRLLRSYYGRIKEKRQRRKSQRRRTVSDKIKLHHLERKAILYVRQSSAYQVQNNLESQKLQYAMRDRLCSLGWHEIEIVDEDLGRTASGTVTRMGFERMVAEVCLGHVGAVAAREVSRFARNSREWQKLVEVCRVVDTLLIDQEMVYTPRQSNDRLLLGLKGSLNEYELDLLRQRSVEARREKAKRGELIVAAPAG
jgi:DNA invertase Pin-like site-specific DNA recombinase